MKTTLITLLLASLATFAFGHEGVALGPSGGRLLEFSKDETMHGEVAEKSGKFHVTLLDKDMKPVALQEQTLTVTTGDRDNPQKLAVEKQGDHFVVPTIEQGQWLIFQYRETPNARPVTARFEYDKTLCPECKKAEWLCACGSEEAEGKKKQ